MQTGLSQVCLACEQLSALCSTDTYHHVLGLMLMTPSADEIKPVFEASGLSVSELGHIWYACVLSA